MGFCPVCGDGVALFKQLLPRCWCWSFGECVLAQTNLENTMLTNPLGVNQFEVRSWREKDFCLMAMSLVGRVGEYECLSACIFGCRNDP